MSESFNSLCIVFAKYVIDQKQMNDETEERKAMAAFVSGNPGWRPLHSPRQSRILATGRWLVTGPRGEENHGCFLPDPHQLASFLICGTGDGHANHCKIFALKKFHCRISYHLATRIDSNYGTVSQWHWPPIFGTQGKLPVAVSPRSVTTTITVNVRVWQSSLHSELYFLQLFPFIWFGTVKSSEYGNSAGMWSRVSKVLLPVNRWQHPPQTAMTLHTTIWLQNGWHT